MLVSKKAKICVTPNAKPQCKSLEYRLRWVPNAKFSRWPCTFLFLFFVDFILVGSRFSVEYELNMIPQNVPWPHLAALSNSGWLGGRQISICRLVLTLEMKNLLRSADRFGCSLFMAGASACSRPSISSLVNRCGTSPETSRELMASR